MSPERWQQIGEVFGGALELEPEERTAYLDQACGGDEALRSEAESLLAYDAASPKVLESPVAGRVGQLIARAPREAVDALAGRRLGPYRVLRELGYGGAGTVYLAVRDDDQYQQRVALKAIHPSRATPDLRRRFRRERQILASLDHPNIARLLDAGTTPDNVPYVVMEWVEGQTIDRYCEAQRLGLEERLRLFQAVCSAVQAAHQNLVVHRDLKPGNIMVLADGTPKLLDFGISKLLNPELSSDALEVTAPSLLPMTPAYASPEQVRGEPITTASDIYALGVLLYQLLTGRLPYQVERASPREIERQICELEPPAPSMSAAAGEAQAGVRRSDPWSWRHRLRGDLDHIVLQALRKEPRRRYGSAAELAEDLTRYLTHRPVRARKATWGYRTWKTVRRHRLATTLLMLLLALGVAVTVQSVRLTQAVASAEQQRERAEQVSAFLIRLFEGADPDQSQGEDLTVREMLDFGAQRIASELAHQPLIQATLLETIGSVYLTLGRVEDSAPLLESALATRRRIQGQEHPDVARSLSRVAFQRFQRGDAGAAEALYRESLEQRRRLYGEAHVEVASALSELAEVHHLRGDLETAEAFYLEALEMKRRLLGSEHPNLAESLFELARLYGDLEDREAAIPLLRQALEIERRTHGDEHTQVAMIENDLALLLKDDDPTAAEPLLRRALSTYRKLLGVQHRWTTTTMRNLARLRQAQGDFDEAGTLFREALAARRATASDLTPGIAYAIQDLGRLALAEGNAEGAEALLRESYTILRDLLPPGDWRTAAAQSILGKCLTQLGRYSEAETALVASHRSLARHLGDQHSRTRRAADRLAEVRARSDRRQVASLHVRPADETGRGSR